MAVIVNRKDANRLLFLSPFDISEDGLKIDKENMVKSRLYKMQDGDIFSVREALIEYFEDNFYEVKLIYNFDKYANSIMPNYIRTGKVFTPEEVVELGR